MLRGLYGVFLLVLLALLYAVRGVMALGRALVRVAAIMLAGILAG